MYVRLKHGLSDYAIAAVKEPASARGAAWLAGYAALAPAGAAISAADARRAATTLAAPAGWEITDADLAPIMARHLLWRGAGRISLPRPFRPFALYFRSQATRLLATVTHLVGHPAHATLPKGVYRGLVLYDFGLFFAAHEYFEDTWRAASGADRFVYHGLIQFAAAFYHHEKGNAKGAVTLLRRALAKLEQAPGRHLGLDLAAVAAAMAPWETRFAIGAAEPWPKFATLAAAT